MPKQNILSAFQKKKKIFHWHRSCDVWCGNKNIDVGRRICAYA